MLKGKDLISPRHKWGLRSCSLKCFTNIFICRKEYWGCCCFETWQICNVVRILSEIKWTSVKISQSQQVQIGIIYLLIRFQTMKFMKKIHHSCRSGILFNIKDVRTEQRWNPNTTTSSGLLSPFHVIYNAVHGHYYPQFRSSDEIADNSIRLVNKLQARKTLHFCRDSNKIRFICKQTRQSGWK